MIGETTTTTYFAECTRCKHRVDESTDAPLDLGRSGWAKVTLDHLGYMNPSGIGDLCPGCVSDVRDFVQGRDQ